MKSKVYLLLLLILFVIPYSIAADEPETDYEREFYKVEQIMLEMKEDGFNILRMNDTLKAAKQIHEGQMNIKTPSLRDFTLVDSYLGQILELKEQGYVAKDELSYVYSVYDEIKLEKPEIDLTEADILIGEMQFEFDSERYDEAYAIAKEAYSRLIDIEGQYTALNLAYKTTTQTLKSFFVNNWLVILIVLGSALIIYLILHNRIKIFLIKHNLIKLAREAEVLEELIKTSQRDYFENNKMSETTYRIRVKKFSDLMRDINRKIPLLKEQLAKRKSTGGKKFNPDDLVTTTGKKVEKVRHGETRVHKAKREAAEAKERKRLKKDKGIKAPIKEREVKFITKGEKAPTKKKPLSKKKVVKKKTTKKKLVKKKKR
jgi:hypothetical protein